MTTHTYSITPMHTHNCQCDECLAFYHGYHDSREPNCPFCMPLDWPHRQPEQPPILRLFACYTCGAESPQTGRARVIDNADPTESFELTCGHWAI